MTSFLSVHKTLQTCEGLCDLDAQFLAFLHARAPFLYESLLTNRACASTIRPLAESTFLLQLAPFLEEFLADFFGVEEEAETYRHESQRAQTWRSSKRAPYDRGSLSAIPLEGREGFACLTPVLPSHDSLEEAKGCLVCHVRDKDSCRFGLKKKEYPHSPRINAQGLELSGCPLEQKISEMHALRQKGYMIGALAMIMVDNPLVALTGARICSDCEAACIFQNHEPINTPAVETEILMSVLKMPWGVEIYALLARWNPLNIKTPFSKNPSGKRVLIVGLGPAGLTLAHYLTQEGHTVWGIEGMKIEPLASHIISKPIRDISHIWESLEERMPQGVGGVAEYGITARWDKNFLTLVRMLLERRTHCLFQGGLRFGSNITPQDAFDWGIDHIALCVGAGRPDIPDFVREMVPGIRLASDFLMTLQGNAAYHPASPSALQIRLPVVVIGGGLTAVDAATEALAFYPRQLMTVEKSASDEMPLSENLEELTRHAHALKGRNASERLNLLCSWGGVTVLYRKTLQESPSMRINPLEVREALKQGVRFRENAVPCGLEKDSQGYVSGVKLKNGEVVPARTVLLATGLFPNTVLFESDPSLKKDTRVSVWGDLDPAYHGSVVKAMASVKNGYKILSESLLRKEDHCDEKIRHTVDISKTDQKFFDFLCSHLKATVRALTPLSEEVFEFVVNAPHEVSRLKWGQFFKVQQRGCFSEGIALEPFSWSVEKQEITFRVHKVGASTENLSKLNVGETILLMGPLGKALKNFPSSLNYKRLPALMNCMMSQICAQCVQVTTNPETGTRDVIYSCQQPYQKCEGKKMVFEKRETGLEMEKIKWQNVKG